MQLQLFHVDHESILSGSKGPLLSRLYRNNAVKFSSFEDQIAHSNL